MIFTSGDHRLVVKVVATVEIVAVSTMLLLLCLYFQPFLRITTLNFRNSLEFQLSIGYR